MRIQNLALFTAAMLSAQQVGAQGTPPPPPPPPPPSTGATSSALNNSGAKGLAQEHGIPLAEAIERIEIMKAARKLRGDLARNEADTFGDLSIKHSPSFQVIVAFTDADEAKLAKRNLDPKLKRYIKVRKAKHSKKNRIADVRGVLKALEAASVRAEAWIDPDTDDVVVRTSNEARVKELVASVALKLPADTVIEAGPFSRPTAATVPSGQFPPKSTDSIGPGFYYYNRYTDNADVRQCTFGFKASYQGRQGLLTAGHCESRGGEYTDAMVRGTGYWHWSGRWVEMYAPTLEYSTVYTRGGTGDKYDFQFHPTPGFTTQSDVFVGGSNYLKVINMDDSTWAGAGDLFCKYGSITGYMCGVLKNANHYWTGD